MVRLILVKVLRKSAQVPDTAAHNSRHGSTSGRPVAEVQNEKQDGDAVTHGEDIVRFSRIADELILLRIDGEVERPEGIRTAMTAINSNDELSWAAVLLMVCSWNRTPPAKKHMPSTSRMLLRIEPTKEDCTTASSHCRVSKYRPERQAAHLDDARMATIIRRRFRAWR